MCADPERCAFEKRENALKAVFHIMEKEALKEGVTVIMAEAKADFESNGDDMPRTGTCRLGNPVA